MIFFDLSSTSFEIDDEDEPDAEQEREPLRRSGASKDLRPDRPQVVVGLAVTREGIPVRCWVFPGNASDQLLVRQVKDDLRAWKLNRVLWVVDTGFASEENRRYLQRAGGRYIMGEKLRAGRANLEALARPAATGRCATTSRSKRCGSARARPAAASSSAVTCTRPPATKRKRTAEDRRDAEALLLAHPSMGRYLTRRRGRVTVDQQKVRRRQVPALLLRRLTLRRRDRARVQAADRR